MAAILGQPWAIDRESLEWGALLDVLTLRSIGEALTSDEITVALAAAADRNGPRGGGQRSGAVAVIPVYGVIAPRMGGMSSMSGGTSAEAIGESFSAAVRDPAVDGIVLDLDSPGGAVQGIDELATLIRAARGQKPIAAVANHRALSAAYYIATAADEITVSPSGMVGSVGVIGAHQDISEAQAKLGIKTTLISAGKFKGEGSEFAPLTDEAKAAMQDQVDTFYGMFVRAVAKGRGVSVDAVRADYGEGRTILAKVALEQGMVDRVGTLDDAIRRVARGAVASRAVPAGDAPAALEAENHYRLVMGEAVGDGPAGVPADATEDGTEPADVDDPAPGAGPITAPVAARQAQRRMREAVLSGGYRLD